MRIIAGTIYHPGSIFFLLFLRYSFITSQSYCASVSRVFSNNFLWDSRIEHSHDCCSPEGMICIMHLQTSLLWQLRKDVFKHIDSHTLVCHAAFFRIGWKIFQYTHVKVGRIGRKSGKYLSKSFTIHCSLPDNAYAQTFLLLMLISLNRCWLFLTQIPCIRSRRKNAG